MLPHHNLRAYQFLFIASLHWRFTSSSAQVPFCYAQGYFIFRKWRFLLLPLSTRTHASHLSVLKQSRVYLARIWTASKPQGRMNWKGRSLASGDFVLGSLASVPAAGWALKTTFEKTEFFSIHPVWDDIIILVLHNNRHAIKIAFIYWILSVGQVLW